MYNLYGGWDNETRSISVSPNFKCRFYTETGCSSGSVLKMGTKGKEDVRDTLSAKFDRKIRSAICEAI